MRLFLCGGGSGKQILNALSSFSRKLDKEKPILYIPLAMEESKYSSCYEWFNDEIKYMKLNSFEMITSSLELSNKYLSDYCAIFIGGGNTFKLLNEIKQYSNDKKIIEYLKNGGTVFGGSAGAIVFGKDINCCLLDDGNNIGITDTSGFNFLNDYSILCHFKNKNFKRNCEFLKEYSKKQKLLYLPEEDVIVIDNNKIRIIGCKKYAIFKNGKVVYHHFANLKKDIMN